MISAAAAPNRRLQSWISGFEVYTESLGSPELFRRWGAISCVAGALEKKCWIVSRGSKLYPNFYTFLIAPPGVGKSIVLGEVERFWRSLPNHHVAPVSLTKAALIDALHDAKRQIVRHGLVPPFVEFNSLLLLISEFGSFMGSYDNDFMATLTTLYDGYQYSERRRTKDLKIDIPEPQLNFLAGTTPAQFKDFMPEGAWDQGFLSRSIIVYAGEQVLTDIFDVPMAQEKLREDLIHDIRAISELYGQFTVDPAAKAAITKWHMAGGPPTPDHPRLVHYLTRRTAHLLKHCMVASVETSNDLVIREKDFEIAQFWLLDMERHIPEIFKAMVGGGDAKAMDECWHFVWQTWSKEKRPVIEPRVIAFLKDKIPSHSVIRVLEIMVRSNLLKQEFTPAGVGYVPRSKGERY